MDDAAIHQRINELSREEEELWSGAASGGGLSEVERSRLHAIKVELDQAYDLLHQRDARRSAGEDPDGAELRPPDVVEDYDQ